MHILDDESRGNPNNTDAKFFNVLKKAWGADQKPPAAAVGKTQRMRNASEFFYVSREKPDRATRAVLAASDMPATMAEYHFSVKHFAKDVKCVAWGWGGVGGCGVRVRLARLLASFRVPAPSCRFLARL